MSSPPYPYSRPTSRYASPTPSQWSGDTYHSQWSREAYPGQQPGVMGYSPYGHAMLSHGQAHHFGSPLLNSARQPSTPPTSSHSQDERTSNQRSQRRTPARKNKTNGAKLDVPELEGPLSELTKNMDDIPMKDMAAWVSRPVEKRREEAMNRKGNSIPRPMNSFMLYRSAYAERTKRWCSQNNHQVVSAVSGKSWKMEPESIRTMYNDLARVERENHQLAYPEYKFSPSKTTTTAPTSRKRKDHAGDNDDFAMADSDDDGDPDYRPSGGARRRARPGSTRSNQSGTPELGAYSPYMDFSNTIPQYAPAPGTRTLVLPFPISSADSATTASGYLFDQGFYDMHGNLGSVDPMGNMDGSHFQRQTPHTFTQHEQQPVGIPGRGYSGLFEGQNLPETPGAFDSTQVDPVLMDEMYYPEHGMATNASAFSEGNFHNLEEDLIATMASEIDMTENLQGWTPHPRTEEESNS